ncbi:MAG: anti-sigma F factor [Methylocystaceae bacterium]
MNIRNRVRLEFFSLPENVGFARSCAAAFAAQLQCTLDDLEEVKLVVSEAVSNAVIHGYQQHSDGTIVMDLMVREDFALEIMVEDFGIGMDDVEKCMEAAYSSDANRMGLGFSFMRSFADDLQVSSVLAEGTTVRMVKRFITTAAQAMA